MDQVQEAIDALWEGVRGTRQSSNGGSESAGGGERNKEGVSQGR